jgi:CTP synthase (UTP-ammonia lyase)
VSDEDADPTLFRNRSVVHLVSPTSIESWKAALEEVENAFKDRVKGTREAATQAISLSEVTDYVTRVANVRQSIASALTDVGRITELADARKAAAAARRAEAQARNAELEIQLTEAKTKREQVGSRTDVAGQYGPDTYANALSAGALAFVGVGGAILGVSEYYRVSGKLTIVPEIGISLFWGIGLALYFIGLLRERSNARLRAALLSRASQQAESGS